MVKIIIFQNIGSSKDILCITTSYEYSHLLNKSVLFLNSELVPADPLIFDGILFFSQIMPGHSTGRSYIRMLHGLEYLEAATVNQKALPEPLQATKLRSLQAKNPSRGLSDVLLG